MNHLQQFNFRAQRVRVVEIDGKPWFHASDVCAVLAIANTASAVTAIPSQHKYRQSLDLPGRAPWFLSESGLYRLIMRSNRPEAASFQDWITDEVLPSIRQTGAYGPVNAAALAVVRHTLEKVDRTVEHRTRHDFYRQTERSRERIASVVAEEADKNALPSTVVERLRNGTIDAVMADYFGDEDARRRIERERESIRLQFERSLTTKPLVPRKVSHHRALRD
ncbi:hypothetical protein CAL29_23230 [Bordetella genomosp. 10]|uniref:Bro-N domain-containing protein n=1 Tax=Bordetella genomosp. 10 TaxID=1416804 RepID=A0A261S327_9BORD|nr:BRO family protein [Bordetella genomosp. 10]OZI30883.1 hypothetical protein CAL29_23230 [Bordetella genomosp. 10]